jgi:hypothetical protein
MYFGLFPLGVKWPEREIDHSSPFCAEEKDGCRLFLSSSMYLHDILLRHKDNLTSRL